jgi:hypothetical protein
MPPPLPLPLLPLAAVVVAKGPADTLPLVLLPSSLLPWLLPPPSSRDCSAQLLSRENACSAPVGLTTPPPPPPPPPPPLSFSPLELSRLNSDGRSWSGVVACRRCKAAYSVLGPPTNRRCASAFRRRCA